MTLIELVFVLVVIGVMLYLLNTLVPMAAPIKTIINAVVIVLVLLWVAEIFGLFALGGPIGHHRLP